jgi:ankyrin repeat protein
VILLKNSLKIRINIMSSLKPPSGGAGSSSSEAITISIGAMTYEISSGGFSLNTKEGRFNCKTLEEASDKFIKTKGSLSRITRNGWNQLQLIAKCPDLVDHKVITKIARLISGKQEFCEGFDPTEKDETIRIENQGGLKALIMTHRGAIQVLSFLIKGLPFFAKDPAGKIVSQHMIINILGITAIYLEKETPLIFKSLFCELSKNEQNEALFRELDKIQREKFLTPFFQDTRRSASFLSPDRELFTHENIGTYIKRINLVKQLGGKIEACLPDDPHGTFLHKAIASELDCQVLIKELYGLSFNFFATDEQGNTPLILAVLTRHAKNAKAIISQMTDPGLKQKMLQHRNKEGYNAFECAVILGCLGLAKLLQSDSENWMKLYAYLDPERYSSIATGLLKSVYTSPDRLLTATHSVLTSHKYGVFYVADSTGVKKELEVTAENIPLIHALAENFCRKGEPEVAKDILSFIPETSDRTSVMESCLMGIEMIRKVYNSELEEGAAACRFSMVIAKAQDTLESKRIGEKALSLFPAD